MLDRPNNAWKLLGLLIAFNLAFLALVVVKKPFRDSEGHAGWAMGDKGQVVVQVAILAEYAMAALCMVFGSNLPVPVEGFVILVCLIAVGFPVVYMCLLTMGSDMLGCLFSSEAAAAADSDAAKDQVVTTVATKNPSKEKTKEKTKKKTKKTEGLAFANPMMDVEDLD